MCGGREYNNFAAVAEVLNEQMPFDLLIHGGAKGADELARDWADVTGVPVRCFKADWKTHGKAAGPIRNQQMLELGKPTLVVAFPGGRGTLDMVNRANRAGVRVLLIS